MLQPPTPHTPDAQPEVPFAIAGHTVPHAPQLFASLTTLTSQPFAADLSQSAKPDLQAAAQVKFAQLAVAFAGIGHVFPQPPQFITSTAVADSQPSSARPSQSEYP